MLDTGVRQEAPAAARTSARSVVLVGVLSALAVIGRLSLYGNPWNRVWAEDGLWWSDARRLGAATLWTPRQGYLHVLDMALVLPATALPFDAYPAYVVLVTAALVGALAAFVYVAARLLVGPRWALLPALALPLAPALAVEGLGAICNVQWCLLGACLWAVLQPWRGALGRWSLVVVAATGLSSFLAIGMLPVALYRRAWRQATVLGGTSLVAVAVATTDTRTPWDPDPDWINLSPSVFLMRAGGWTGRWLDNSTYWVAAILGAAQLAVVLVALLTARDRRQAWPLLGVATVFVVVTSLVERSFSARYVATGSMFTAAALAFLLPQAPRWAQRLMVGVLAVAVVWAGPVVASRADGPTWACVGGQVQVVEPPPWYHGQAPC